MNNKVIKVLDREHGKKVIEFWKQYCDTGKLIGSSTEKDKNVFIYYGTINGEFDCYSLETVKKANAEIIELPEEKTYPRVMLVSEDKKDWRKMVVFMEKCGKYLAWYNSETLEEAENTFCITDWQFAKEFEPIEVTLEEIAEWKGTIKELIKIKQ